MNDVKNNGNDLVFLFLFVNLLFDSSCFDSSCFDLSLGSHAWLGLKINSTMHVIIQQGDKNTTKNRFDQLKCGTLAQDQQKAASVKALIVDVFWKIVDIYKITIVCLS